MTSIEEHLAAVRVAVGDLGVKRIPAVSSSGRRLVENIFARLDSPTFDNSQMDGYAIPTVPGPGKTTRFEVGPTIAAGTDPNVEYPDGLGVLAAPIMTGAKVPAGAVAIVPVEKCQPAQFLEPGAQLTVPDVPKGQFIRTKGSDIRAGDKLLDAGSVITPAGVATLVGQQIDDVPVQPTASILVLTGGKEVSGHGVASIPDSNAPMINALANRYGIDVAGYVTTDDDPEVLSHELAEAVDKHRPTAIVSSGGISAGKFEVVRQVMPGWYGHVAQQPGGPQGLSQFAGVPGLNLPGNPISTLVSFRLFVAPVLGIAPEPITAQLAEPATGLPAKEQLRRGNLKVIDGVVTATVVGGASSHLISQAAQANCLIRIPTGAALATGDIVKVYPL